MPHILTLLRDFLPLLGTLAMVLCLLTAANVVLKRRWQKTPHMQFRFQLIMLALTLAGLLALVVALPISDSLRGQFLSLIGILLSASIALSSTTFIGNILAGFMLKSAGKVRPGDFITVADLTGRITEMDLLQTEVQTELRDLVTVPNIYMVTQPLKVVRASGSIITAEISLGYDVSRPRVTGILRDAASASGLKDCFVHVRALGDFSITYRVAGLLEDIQSLITARSALLVAILDALHDADIEVASPNLMTTRTMAPEAKIQPPSDAPKRSPIAQVAAEDIAFDKADDAASAEKLRQLIRVLDEDIRNLGKAGGPESELERARLLAEKAQQEILIEEILDRIEAAEGDGERDG